MRREPVHTRVQQRIRREPEQLNSQPIRNALRVRTADQLVEHAQRVTHRPGTGANHQRQRGRLDRDALRRTQRGHVIGQRLRRDQPERVVMRPGPDRPDHLVRLGGREDELEVRRRLLDQLQQGVEALRGHHVRLVDDVDLVAALDRREERPLAQVARVVDTTVRGGVDLDHVDAAGAAAGQVRAGLADAARLGDRALLAVDRAGQDPGAGGLAAAARAGEQVGVVHPVVAQCVPQRNGDMVLPDHLGERLRAIPAVQRKGCFHDGNPSAAHRQIPPNPASTPAPARPGQGGTGQTPAGEGGASIASTVRRGPGPGDLASLVEQAAAVPG